MFVGFGLKVEPAHTHGIQIMCFLEKQVKKLIHNKKVTYNFTVAENIALTLWMFV